MEPVQTSVARQQIDKQIYLQAETASVTKYEHLSDRISLQLHTVVPNGPHCCTKQFYHFCV
jgi:hypothetical protein